MTKPSLKNACVILVGIALAALGASNVHRKATTAVLEDGVFWKDSPAGVVAGRVAAGGPGARAGLRPGDLLLAVDGREVLSADEVDDALGGRRSGDLVGY
jgi:S1-C subfamily serine protease